MADAAEQLVVSLEARIRDFERNFIRANKTANDNFSRIENRGKQAARNLESSFTKASAGVNEQLARMATTSAAALSAALSVSKMKDYADEWTSLGNKIAATGETMTNVGNRQSQLADIAIRSRSSLEGVGELYVGLTRSTKEMGASQAQVLQATETVSKAFAIGGQSAETAKGAIIQLNQAFAAGALRGDELNSVLEGAPALAAMVAKEFGVSVGQLKTLGEQGKLTSDRVFSAILKGSADVEAQFARTNSTISQSFTNLTTAMVRYVGTADQANGTSRMIAGGINAMANNMNIAAPAALTLGAALAGLAIGGPIGAGIAGTAAALATFGPLAVDAASSIQPIAGEMATIGDYAAVAFDLVKDKGGQAVDAVQKGFAKAADYVTQALSSINAGEAFSALLAAVKAVANATIGAFVFSAKTIKAAWDTLGAALGEVIVNSMNGVISSIEATLNKIIGAINSLITSANGMAGKVGIDLGLGAVGNVSLGRVDNKYAGAGKAAGEAFGEAFSAFSTDYVGGALDAADGAMKAWTAEANKRAEDRKEQERRNNALNSGRGKDDGTLDQKLKPSAGASKDGKGGSDAEKASEFDKEVARLQKRTGLLEAERQAVGKSAEEAAKAEAAFKLMNAAKASGMPIDDALKAKVNALATAYAQAKTKLEEAQQRQQAFQDAQKQLSQTLTDSIADLVLEGKSLKDVFADLTKQLAKMALQGALMGDGPLAGLFGMGKSSNGVGGILGGLFGGIFGGVKLASGGYVSGPGTSTSDSIPARLSAGEFVVNAKATAQHRDLLAAINSGQVRAFAAGGIVAPASMSAPIGQAAAPASVVTTIAPNITVNASGGTKEQNDDLAEKLGKTVEAQLRQLIVGELRAQLRPQGVLNP